jgi:WD40 repeat protein
LSQLAYVDLQGDVIIEDVPSGRRRKLLHAPAGPVYKLKMSRDDRVITALTEEGKEYQIDIRTGGTIIATNPKQPLPAPRVLGVSPNGKYETRLGNDCVEVHRSGQGEPIACLAVKFEPPPAPPGLTLCYGAAPYSCVFSSDNKRLAVWRTSSKFLIYDLKSRKELRLDTLGDQIVTASFSPDSHEIYLVHRHDETSVERWSVNDGRRLPDMALENDGRNALAAGSAWLSPNGRVLIAPQDRSLTGLSAWRPQSGRLLWQFSSEGRDVRQLDFSPDCRRFQILSGTGNRPGLLELLDAESGAPIPENPGHQERVMGLAFSPDGRHLVSSDGVRESIAWDVRTHRAVSRVAIPWNRQGSYSPIAGRTRWISATGVDDISIQPYDSAGEPHLLRGAGRDFGAMALSGDERVVAVLNEQLNRLCVWNPETAETIWCAELGHPSDQTINFGQLQFSGDDRSVVALSETGEILRWRRADGTPLAPVPLMADGEASHGPAATGFFITSQRLAGEGDPCISWLVKDATKEVLFASSLRRDFLSSFLQLPSTRCLFTPDGRLAVLVVSGGRIMVRRAADGDTLAELAGHAGDIFTYAISPDGSLLASAGTDHVIYLWDLSRYR